MISAGVLLTSNRGLIFFGPLIVLDEKSLSAVKWDLMKPTRRPSVSLVSETRMFLWMTIHQYEYEDNISVLSTVFESLVFVCLEWFVECSGVLPTTQFPHRKTLGTCDALLCVSHTLQSELESGQEARIVQIDFRPAWIGSTINEFSKALNCGYWRLCFVYINTVSIKSITAPYGGLLLK